MNTLKVIYKHSMHLIPQKKVKENSGKAFAIPLEKTTSRKQFKTFAITPSSVDYQSFR
jgi:hypothetical protein